jgi:predicted nucleic acid-binding protein
MIVISDTTPIISLMKTGRLELLQKLFGVVYIPEAVLRWIYK